VARAGCLQLHVPIKHQNKYRTPRAFEALAPFLMTVGKGQIDCFHGLLDIVDPAAITVFEVAQSLMISEGLYSSSSWHPL
jgi:hypothetical protein